MKEFIVTIKNLYQILVGSLHITIVKVLKRLVFGIKERLECKKLFL